MTNIWRMVSLLGVKEGMPVYKIKSIVLFNQIVRILMLMITIATLFIYLGLGAPELAKMFIPVILVLGFTLFLNLHGKIKTAGLILSILLPLLFLFISVYTKLNNSLSSNVFLYIVPRIAIVVTSILPVALIGFIDPKKAIFGSITGVVVYLSYDFVHEYFNVGFDKMPFAPHYYIVFILSLAGMFLFTVLLIILSQGINTEYEKMVIAQKNEIEMQKAEIEAQRDEIEIQRDCVTSQRDEIMQQKKQMTDSILYAERIQIAILPHKEQLNELFPENFILFRPKDIVSGDFYWFSQINSLNNSEQVLVTVADCTGHGVPGAFMSMLGISSLSEIINKFEEKEIEIKANQVLDELRIKIKSSLHQTGKAGESKDGMDIALCIINITDRKMQYAGANNPAWIVRENDSNSELIELKPNHMPIGIYLKELESFTNHEIDLQNGDTLYLSSDGYEDQFGGGSGRKFLAKNLKSLIVSIHSKPMIEQKQILFATLDQWKCEREQIDDVTVMGLKINI